MKRMIGTLQSCWILHILCKQASFRFFHVTPVTFRTSLQHGFLGSLDKEIKHRHTGGLSQGRYRRSSHTLGQHTFHLGNPTPPCWQGPSWHGGEHGILCGIPCFHVCHHFMIYSAAECMSPGGVRLAVCVKLSFLSSGPPRESTWPV